MPEPILNTGLSGRCKVHDTCMDLMGRMASFSAVMTRNASLYVNELYGYLYRHHVRLLEHFHQRCLHSILKIHWQDRITNIEVLETANITSNEALLLPSQLRWAGHIAWMDDSRLPKIVLYGELTTGKRNKGDPRKRFKDSLKKSLSVCRIDHRQWEAQTIDCDVWRCYIRRATDSFETERRTSMKEKKRRRIDPIVPAVTTPSFVPAVGESAAQGQA
ncbi:uncharacterized protein [Heterodontus francisci]|uniref:uncharacterized protein isoform X2 n=1 Tax=Heterodontus francisci TaxID=7792 RepID=UPI00355C86AB